MYVFFSFASSVVIFAFATISDLQRKGSLKGGLMTSGTQFFHLSAEKKRWDKKNCNYILLESHANSFFS